MHRTLTFQNSNIDEGGFDENDEPTVPGGRDLSSKLAKDLEAHTGWVRDFSQHSYYGWTFDTRYKGYTFVLVTNPAGDVIYLTVSMRWYGLKSLVSNRPRRVFDEYCNLLSKLVADLVGTTDQEWGGYAT